MLGFITILLVMVAGLADMAQAAARTSFRESDITQTGRGSLLSDQISPGMIASLLSGLSVYDTGQWQAKPKHPLIEAEAMAAEQKVKQCLQNAFAADKAVVVDIIIDLSPDFMKKSDFGIYEVTSRHVALFVDKVVEGIPPDKVYAIVRGKADNTQYYIRGNQINAKPLIYVNTTGLDGTDLSNVDGKDETLSKKESSLKQDGAKKRINNPFLSRGRRFSDAIIKARPDVQTLVSLLIGKNNNKNVANTLPYENLPNDIAASDKPKAQNAATQKPPNSPGNAFERPRFQNSVDDPNDLILTIPKNPPPMKPTPTSSPNPYDSLLTMVPNDPWPFPLPTDPFPSASTNAMQSLLQMFNGMDITPFKPALLYFSNFLSGINSMSILSENLDKALIDLAEGRELDYPTTRPVTSTLFTIYITDSSRQLPLSKVPADASLIIDLFGRFANVTNGYRKHNVFIAHPPEAAIAIIPTIQYYICQQAGGVAKIQPDNKP